MSQLLRIITVVLLLGCPKAGGEETPAQWYRDGRAAVERAKRARPIEGKAKNVILFIGDGMNIDTVTAARILAGQQRGGLGEEYFLRFERLPYSALIKTFNVDRQTGDSAGTMTAMITGVKSNVGMLSVNQKVRRGDCSTMKGNKLTTLFELAEQAGLSTGVVSTARVTHATPGACYAHTPERNWECSTDLPAEAKKAGFPDIARQLIEFPYGNGLEVVLGGGRREFFPTSVTDPEYPTRTGTRDDGRNLVEEWKRRTGGQYVWNEAQFTNVKPDTRFLLGLFQPDHMRFEHDRPGDKAGEPSLTEMTVKAIELLAQNPKGYVLMVEAARIDHAHHLNNAYRALTETIELDNAVHAALEMTSRTETLIIVTADHGHMMAMGGHARRGNPVLGKVVRPAGGGTNATTLALDAAGRPYTALFYAMGPGYPGKSLTQPEGPKRFPHFARGYQYVEKGRPDLTDVDTTAPDYVTEAGIPMAEAPHSAADVPLYADGPQAYLFHGVLEQNVIFHVMVEALGLKDRAKAPE